MASLLTFLLLLPVAPGVYTDAALVQAIQRGRRWLLPDVDTAAWGAVGGRGVALPGKAAFYIHFMCSGTPANFRAGCVILSYCNDHRLNCRACDCFGLDRNAEWSLHHLSSALIDVMASR